jgi:hypothetical protein
MFSISRKSLCCHAAIIPGAEIYKVLALFLLQRKNDNRSIVLLFHTKYLVNLI